MSFSCLQVPGQHGVGWGVGRGLFRLSPSTRSVQTDLLTVDWSIQTDLLIVDWSIQTDLLSVDRSIQTDLLIVDWSI